jgi:hypothetical protein
VQRIDVPFQPTRGLPFQAFGISEAFDRRGFAPEQIVQMRADLILGIPADCVTGSAFLIQSLAVFGKYQILFKRNCRGGERPGQCHNQTPAHQINRQTTEGMQ